METYDSPAGEDEGAVYDVHGGMGWKMLEGFYCMRWVTDFEVMEASLGCRAAM